MTKKKELLCRAISSQQMSTRKDVHVKIVDSNIIAQELKSAIEEWKAKKKAKTTWLADPKQDRPDRLSIEPATKTGMTSETSFKKGEVSKSSKQSAVIFASASTGRSNTLVVAQSYERYNLQADIWKYIQNEFELKKSMDLVSSEICFLRNFPSSQEKGFEQLDPKEVIVVVGNWNH